MSKKRKKLINIIEEHTVDGCKLNHEDVDTRWDTARAEEDAGPLFVSECPDLDTTLPKRKDRFIVDCPTELPEVPKAVLKQRRFPEVSIPGVPTAEIPKALMSRLLGCCLKGRTGGFDIEFERDLEEDGTPVSIDPDEALLPFSIQLGDKGIIKMGLDIQAESCFCDTTCGDSDFYKFKLRFGSKYVDFEEATDGEIIVNDDDAALKIPGDALKTTQIIFGQIVDYIEEETPSEYSNQGFYKTGNKDYLNCKTEEYTKGRDTSSAGSSSSVNRWRYKVKLLNYSPCGVTASNIEGSENKPGNDIVFPAYNLNEFIVSSSKLPAGFLSSAAWHATYSQIQARYRSGAKTRLLPCPVGSIVQIIDPEAIGCCSDSDRDNCMVNTCMPPLLFYQQNRDVPEKPIIFKGGITAYVNSSTNVSVACEETGETISAKLPVELGDEVAEGDSAVCVMDTLGNYWALPYTSRPKETTMFAIYDGTGFSPTDLDGTPNYDETRRIPSNRVKKAPYLPKIATGGIYTLMWMPKQGKWVVIGGSCPNENENEPAPDYTNYTTINIRQHLPNGDPTAVAEASGVAVTIGAHDEFAVLEQPTCKILDLDGLNKSKDLFYSEPSFFLSQDHTQITFAGLKLNPGKAGLAVYTFCVSSCNSADKDFYTVVFNCMEINTKPIATPENIEIPIKTTVNNIVVATVSGDDTYTLTDVVLGGGMTSGSLTLVDNTIKLSGTAGEVTGTFYATCSLDNGHDGVNLRTDNSTSPPSYVDDGLEKVTIPIKITNVAPHTTIFNNYTDSLQPDSEYSGVNKIWVGYITDSNENKTNFIANVLAIKDPNSIISGNVSISVDNKNIYVELTTSELAAGSVTIVFQVDDEFREYTTGEPNEAKVIFTVPNNPPTVSNTGV